MGWRGIWQRQRGGGGGAYFFIRRPSCRSHSPCDRLRGGQRADVEMDNTCSQRLRCQVWVCLGDRCPPAGAGEWRCLARSTPPGGHGRCQTRDGVGGRGRTGALSRVEGPHTRPAHVLILQQMADERCPDVPHRHNALAAQPRVQRGELGPAQGRGGGG